MKNKMIFVMYVLIHLITGCASQPRVVLNEPEEFGKKMYEVKLTHDGCENPYCIVKREHWENGLKFMRRNGQIAATYYYEK